MCKHFLIFEKMERIYLISRMHSLSAKVQRECGHVVFVTNHTCVDEHYFRVLLRNTFYANEVF